MNSRSIRTSLATLVAVALSGAIALSRPALSQPGPAQPPSAPAASAPAPGAAPVERRPPMGPGMRSRPGMMQGRSNGGGNFRGAAMRHRGSEGRGGFHGRPGFRGGHGGGFGSRGGQEGGMAGGFHIGPPGMWWKNPGIVQRLTLTPDQVKRMDGIFQESRIQLIDLRANIEKQNALLEPMLSANPPDTAKAMAQIDKVAQARADLEKADARMLLGIRGVLTPEQWTKLHERRTPDTPGGQGPAAQGGPGGQGAYPGGYGPGAGYGGGRGQRGGYGSNLVDPIQQP